MRAYSRRTHIPKPASGFSALILSRQSWLKNMYADKGLLGLLGSFSFFDLEAAARGAFSAFSAALRWKRGRYVSIYAVQIVGNDEPWAWQSP